MDDAQRQQLGDRIAAGEARFLDRAGETAIEAKDRFTHFAREHPLTMIAGGLALGVLISGLFPRSPTRRAARKTVGLATVGAEAAMTYLHHATKEAKRSAHRAERTGARTLDHWTDAVAEAARRITEEAVSLADSTGDNARAAQATVSRRLSRAWRRSH